jgi:hypothetical protein
MRRVPVLCTGQRIDWPAFLQNQALGQSGAEERTGTACQKYHDFAGFFDQPGNDCVPVLCAGNK